MIHLMDLPKELVVDILIRCDEPSRDKAVLVSKALKEYTSEARRLDYSEAAKRPNRWTTESLPTFPELAARGCPHPNRANIFKTMQGSTSHPAKTGPLTKLYSGAHSLAIAQAAGCTHHNETTTLAYEGGFRDGNRHGYGIATLPEGTYQGEWQADRMEGVGFWSKPDGERYEGEWKAGMREGQGYQLWHDGDSYTGGWRKNRRHGYGVMSSDRSHYEGQFKDDSRQGYGICSYSDGITYDGMWRGDLWHGKGVWTNSIGDRYDGHTLAGRRHGYGVWSEQDGVTYDGWWRDDGYHGYGKSTGADGERYTGYHEAGLRHGRGVLIQRDGTRCEGEFQAGVFIKPSKQDKFRRLNDKKFEIDDTSLQASFHAKLTFP